MKTFCCGGLLPREAAQLIAGFHATLCVIGFCIIMVLWFLGLGVFQYYPYLWGELEMSKLTFVLVTCALYFVPNLKVFTGIEKEKSGKFESWLAMTLAVISVTILES